MPRLSDFPSKNEVYAVGGVPEGYDARFLLQILERVPGQVLLHVARDDLALVRLKETLAFFDPGKRILDFPAWDCMPYDRVSPHGEVVARRIETLSTLAEMTHGAGGPVIVLATANAIVQRVPPRSMFDGSRCLLAAGEDFDQKAVTAFLVREGYHRTETVREPGEYAMRGGIMDLFPPGYDEPLRLDLFGDTIESIRTFDPLTQCSTGKSATIELKPVSEMMLDGESIERFRTGYRELFGAGGGHDPLYESVSSGRRFDGMEHWLPLFHEKMETLFDYLPRATPMTLDYQAEEEIANRRRLITDHYESRRGMMKAALGAEMSYNPLPPERLYLGEGEWELLCAARARMPFSPFIKDDAAGTIDAGGRGGRDFADIRLQPQGDVFGALKETLQAERKKGRVVVIAAYSEGSRERMAGMFADHSLGRLESVSHWQEAQAQGETGAVLAVLGLEKGFSDSQSLFLSEQDIFGERLSRVARKKRRASDFLTDASALGEGDFVVHIDHGIGRYDRLATLEVENVPHDFLQITYAGDDRLFVPVENIEVLSRYGSAEMLVALDKLGGAAWQARKARVKKRLRDIAQDLIRVAAERETRDGEVLTVEHGLYDEFCARFPYAETEDQARAIEDTLADMASGRPMDRLVCGDVGFGKTEVALRAAFVAVSSGVQVAVVTPTTLLARQHYKTFRERFAGLGVGIEQLSRLTPAKHAAEIRQGLAEGAVRIVIGTHALLGKNIQFSHLGLMIVDEEQHFGVAQKERLKNLRANIHVLTLTATPIPRTLQMALSGVRDMSIMASAPVDRLAVRTFILPFDPMILREAIARERQRGGQVFYVCPRIEDLDGVRAKLKTIAGEARVAVAHGQMAPAALEQVMGDFYDGKYDILLSTSIIESGLDIPSANTLIVHRADMFGLAQLYQIRGRIGRSKRRAYAYLTLPPGRLLTRSATQRLEVLHNLDTLGAGFQLASHDMDIRGAGNLLGEEQSGHVREVGIELYQHMIEEAVAQSRGGKQSAAGTEEEEWTPQIQLGSPVLIPESYVADLGVRLSLYRRIAPLVEKRDMDAFAIELHDRFGPLPEEVNNLLDVIAIKQLCKRAGVEKLDAGPKGAIIAFRRNQFAHPERLVEFITSERGRMKLRPDHKIVYRQEWATAKERIRGAADFIGRLAALAGGEGKASAP